MTIAGLIALGIVADFLLALFVAAFIAFGRGPRDDN